MSDNEEKMEQNGTLLPSKNKFNHIRNKQVRQAKAQKMIREKKKQKRETRKKRDSLGKPKGVPHTIESLRVIDETIIGNLDDEENVEIKKDLEQDELSAYFREEYEPKVLITYSDNPLQKTRAFGRELTRIIPNSLQLHRRRSSVKKMVESAIKRRFTDIVIVNENQKEPNGLLVVHLPNGPTAHFKLSNVKTTKDMGKSKKEFTRHRPEVILNHFSTRLGLTVGRMLGALFHYSPQYKGRHVVTFHNQRDYIFFRHHRYDFDKNGKRTKLMELGPRFTLRLRSLQKGTFDSKSGDFEWILAGKRHTVEANRRKFVL